MAVLQRITEAEYRDLALDDPDGRWEFWDGVPREKPDMSAEHNDVISDLGPMLYNQLDRNAFRVRYDSPRARTLAGNVYLPDVAVIPTAYRNRLAPRSLELYADPLPLVVEVWSPSTGEYDLSVKLRGYQERGDAEIWFIHPYDRTLRARRRQPDGSYQETLFREGIVEPVALPGVAIDLDVLFAD